MATAVKNIAPARTFKLRQIALPVEHGGWSFLFEPLIAGLALAFSAHGLWIVLIMIGAFLVRRPLSIFISHLVAGRRTELSETAFKMSIGPAALFLTGVAGAIVFVEARALLPLAVLLPLAAVQLYCDVVRNNRSAAAEMAAAFTMSASAAAIILAGGGNVQFATAVWLYLAAKSAGSILYVRNRLRLEKGKGHSKALPAVTHIIGSVLVTLMAFDKLLPMLTIPIFALLTFRSIFGLSKYRSPAKAVKIGIYEVIFGVIGILALIFGQVFGI